LAVNNDVTSHGTDCTVEEIWKRLIGISLAELVQLLEYLEVINPDFKLEDTGIESGVGAVFLSTEVL
jgi:hypothetical protein